jgi:uncharacterized DUF497 family protein
VDTVDVEGRAALDVLTFTMRGEVVRATSPRKAKEYERDERSRR